MPKVAAKVVMEDKDFLVNEHAATYLKGVLVFDEISRKWGRMEQPITQAEFFSSIQGLQETLSQILTELRVHTHYLHQGLTVKDEPESIRNELSTI